MASVAPPLQQHQTPGQTATSDTTDPPNLSLPLINEPAQSSPPAQITTLDMLQYLVGTWTNQKLASGKGGPDDPYSYNLMVLPQVDPTSPDGYILKSMSYYEEITFSPIHGNAANRGGTGTQVSNALFYEQRVYISEISGTPASDQLVHAENGAWLFLSDTRQLLGPYGPDYLTGSTAPTQEYSIVKQIAVPHGNSVLALGNATGPTPGSPTITAPPQVYPENPAVHTGPYTNPTTQAEMQGNPNVAYTENPNLPLIQALQDTATSAPVVEFIELSVDSANGKGAVTNIGFEQQHANVMEYSATFWLEKLQGQKDYNQLQYSQTIILSIPIAGQTTPVLFPHITTNTLTRVTSWDQSAADAELNADLQS